jgi:hypothetical protein
MSAFGPSRRFAATQKFGRFRSETDIEPDLIVSTTAGRVLSKRGNV